MEENFDLKETAPQSLLEDVSECDHSDHYTDMERSVVEFDKAVSSMSRVVVEYSIIATPSSHLDVVADVTVSPIALLDSKSLYTNNLETYGGKQPKVEFTAKSKCLLEKIIEKYFYIDRNITTYFIYI